MLEDGFFADLQWFARFLEYFNGRAIFDKSNDPKHKVYIDACLQGLGGSWDKRIKALPIPDTLSHLNIVHLEMVNIIVALKLSGKFWSH